MRKHEWPLPWLVFPPAMDLANTVVAGPTGPVDLLTGERELALWIDAERDRIPGAPSAAGRLEQVLELRDSARAVLHSRARAQAPPPTDVRRLNEWSRRSPTYLRLDPDGTDATTVHASANGFDVFRAAVAGSAIELAAGADGRVPECCRAPGCGMLFLRDDPRQRWCSRSCGNRARQARHAARRAR